MRLRMQARNAEAVIVDHRYNLRRMEAADWARARRRLTDARAGWGLGRRMASRNTLGIGRAVLQCYSQCFDAYHRCKAYQANASARRAYRRDARPLDAIERSLVERLRATGLARTEVSALLPDVDWKRLQAESRRWLDTPAVREREQAYRTSLERKEGHGKKDYLVRMFGVAGDAEMDAGSPWLSLFLHDRLLAVINGYLGVFSKLNAIDVWNTVPVVHDGADQGSQRWHRDPEDSRLVKVFLYLSDVGAGAGAMQYVAHSRRGDRYGRLWPQKFPAGNYPPAGALERIVDPRDRIDCGGPSGTLLFVDTCGFHRGGRATSAQRVLATSIHTTPASPWPRRFRTAGDLETVARTAAQRWAVTIP